jgi:hypothetical protein
VDQFFFWDQSLGVAEEEEEGSEGLGLDRQYFARPDEGELALADFEVAEAVNKGLNSHHNSIIPPQENLDPSGETDEPSVTTK